MARGYYRKQRYIVRFESGRGIPASSWKQVWKIVNESEKGQVSHIETENGDVNITY